MAMLHDGPGSLEAKRLLNKFGFDLGQSEQRILVETQSSIGRKTPLQVLEKEKVTETTNLARYS